MYYILREKEFAGVAVLNFAI